MENENTIVLDIEKDKLKKIFGSLDENARKIENKFNVTLINRDNKLKIISNNKNNAEKTKDVIMNLNKLLDNGQDINEQELNYCLFLNDNNQTNKIIELDSEVIGRTIKGNPIKPKTLGQKKYVDSIKKNMITFGIGPAGTGKTYLAICMAVQLLKNGDVNKLILTRPAIEAGEKLGFLPGDLQSKIDPYLRPLYDALYQTMGIDSFNQNLEKGTIEVAPLAYMRGRTLDNAFIILDEAQNTTIPQMKMFLTRIGFNSKVVVTGDDTQIDLHRDVKSGLIHVSKILQNIDSIEFCYLNSKDVVRHPIVQKIVIAFEKYDQNNRKNNK